MPVLSKTLPDDPSFSSAEALTRAGPWIALDLTLPKAQGVADDDFRPSDRVNALIDTGADFNMVTNSYATRLGAKPIDYITSFGVHGVRPEPSPVYLLGYRVADLREMRIERFVGVDLPSRLPILLGRIFLAGKILIYDGAAGRVTLTV